jgi:hypothetical protein
MNTSRVLGLLCGMAIGAGLPACGHPKPVESVVPAYTLRGVLRPTQELQARPFTVQQRIHGKYAGGDATMECVVQLANGKLTVLGLTPFGTRAFVIEQHGLEVKFEKFIDRDLPVEPEAVLYDIHRVFFRALPERKSDGVSEGQDNGDMVRERWQGGHIVERRFESLEGPVSNLVVVTFDGAPAPVIAPRVRITNAAYAYTLEIENTEQQTLEGNTTVEVETAEPLGVPPPEAPEGVAPPAPTPGPAAN